jgi:uncharacterized repeat protein (TIGR02543 family)
MATLSKPVLTEPAAAVAAGCYATCTAYVENETREVSFLGSDDKAYRTFSNYLLQAFPANGWTLREFVYTDTWTDTDGNSHTTERHRHPANSGTVYPTSLHTEYETDPADWTSVEPEGKHIDASPTHTFSNVKAYFDAPGTITYTVSASSDPVNGGTVQVGPDDAGTSSSYVVTSGDSVTVVATPSSGYVFDGWYEGSARISTSASTTITNVTSNRSLEARFRQLVHIQVVAYNDFYVTLNGISGTTSSAWTVAEGDFPLGDTITITASTPDPILNPFKAWYLNPSAWGNPEQTGTLVPGAGATYTFTASANATYFATFNFPTAIYLDTRQTIKYNEPAPDAVVSANGHTDGTNEFVYSVVPGSSVTVETTEYGGEINISAFFSWVTKLYFAKWQDRHTGATVSTNRQYTFTTSGESTAYNLRAIYSNFAPLQTAVMPNASMGTITASPSPRDGNYFEYWTNVTLTATPSAGFRFVKWTAVDEHGWETDITTNNQCTIEINDDIWDTTYRAYFEWDGTDLLVNSANLGSPVQLVYDPATNLLVADY